METAKGEFPRHATSIGTDSTGLSRWNYVDVDNGRKKLRFISACQSVKSSSIIGTVHSQLRRYFLVRNINVFPRKFFISHLIEFISDTINTGMEIILTVDENKHMVKNKLAKKSIKLV